MLQVSALKFKEVCARPCEAAIILLSIFLRRGIRCHVFFDLI